jgi:hypothetical protein
MPVRRDGEQLKASSAHPPVSKGFGQTILNDLMSAANIVRNYASDGFHYVLKVPLRRVAAAVS